MLTGSIYSSSLEAGLTTRRCIYSFYDIHGRGCVLLTKAGSGLSEGEQCFLCVHTLWIILGSLMGDFDIFQLIVDILQITIDFFLFVLFFLYTAHLIC